MDVTRHGRGICEHLAGQLGETVNLAIAQEGHAINLDQVRGPSAVTAHNWVGGLTPLHHTGYALTVEEYEVGLNAMAAPIREYGGRVVAAVSASGPPTGSPRTGCRTWPPYSSRGAGRSATGWAIRTEPPRTSSGGRAAPNRLHGRGQVGTSRGRNLHETCET
jgi:hypothetical protein